MGKWYKNNRFLNKLTQFQKLEDMELGELVACEYSIDYALWKLLKNGHFSGFKFERQKVVLGNVVSFYCKDAKLVVDVEHVSHEIRHKEEIESDHFLQKAGVKVLRFHKDAILDRPNSVKNSILEELEHTKTQKFKVL